MRTIAIGMALVLALSTLATGGASADSWSSHNVIDHLRGNIGTGAAALGEVVSSASRRQPGQLIANCSDNSTTVFVGSEHVYFGGESTLVEYALDGGPVQKSRWQTCASGRCVGLWSGAGIPFLKSLMGKAMLRLSVHVRFDEPIRAEFPVAGAQQALWPVGRTCGWITKSFDAKE